MKKKISILKNKIVWIPLVSLAIFVLLYSLWTKPAKPIYQTYTVTYADIAEKVTSSGVLQPSVKVDVGAQVSGQLQKIYVVLGKPVKKGHLLATIDDSIAKNDLLNTEATLEQQAAQREAKKSELEQAERELIRQTKMLKSEATSKFDVEQAELNLRKSKAEIRVLDAQIHQTKIAVDTARTKLSYTQILAPIDGDVVNIATQEGQTVIAVQQVPIIMTLAKLDTMTVKALVSEADVASLHPGLDVYFTTLGKSEERHFGKLRTIQPTPEKVNGATFYSALFDVPNTNRDLWTDMTVQVSFILNEAKHVLVLPVIALSEQDSEGRYEVKILNKDGAVNTHKLHIALNDHVNAQIKDGLVAGDRVIIGEQLKPENKKFGLGF